MIKRLESSQELSVCENALLPCIVNALDFGVKGDGAYSCERDGEQVGCIGVCACRAFASFSSPSDFCEAIEFLRYLGCREIVSNVDLGVEKTEVYPLLRLENNKICDSSAELLGAECVSADFISAGEVLFAENQDAVAFYTDISRKILKNRGAVSVKKIDGKTVSVAASPYVYKDFAVICGVATESKYTHKGFASECVNALCRSLLDNGVKNIYLWCESELLRFYGSLGFEKCGEVYITRC